MGSRGRLVAAVEAISKARGARVDCFLHPDMFAERALRRPSGEILPFESIPVPEALAEAGANVLVTREPRRIAGGAFRQWRDCAPDAL